MVMLQTLNEAILGLILDVMEARHRSIHAKTLWKSAKDYLQQAEECIEQAQAIDGTTEVLYQCHDCSRYGTGNNVICRYEQHSDSVSIDLCHRCYDKRISKRAP